MKFSITLGYYVDMGESEDPYTVPTRNTAEITTTKGAEVPATKREGTTSWQEIPTPDES